MGFVFDQGRAPAALRATCVGNEYIYFGIFCLLHSARRSPPPDPPPETGSHIVLLLHLKSDPRPGICAAYPFELRLSLFPVIRYSHVPHNVQSCPGYYQTPCRYGTARFPYKYTTGVRTHYGRPYTRLAEAAQVQEASNWLRGLIDHSRSTQPGAAVCGHEQTVQVQVPRPTMGCWSAKQAAVGRWTVVLWQ